ACLYLYAFLARFTLLSHDLMLQCTSRLLILAMVLVAGYVLGWPSHEAHAQQAQQDSQINPSPIHRRPTLTDRSGPPKITPEPKDFGPHFDFPSGGSQNLTCGPSGSQYISVAPHQRPLSALRG